MDAVYVCRSGQNFELRFSLRSLAANVPVDAVHIVGGWPPWVNQAYVRTHLRPTARTKYATTTAHLRYACEHPDISDPFMLWNDDFYALQPVPGAPSVHRGELGLMVERFRGASGHWADGLRATTAALAPLLPGQTLYSYELHVPLLVHKAAMLEALDVCAGIRTTAPHKRTVYGNLAQLGGVPMRDPKVTRHSLAVPGSVWLSSDDAGFSSGTAPQLKALFPEPCPYEITTPSPNSRGSRRAASRWSGSRSGRGA